MSGERNWIDSGWSVMTNKAPILDSHALDELETQLTIPMPEMVFGKNCLVIEHKASGFKLKFDAYSALNEVDKSYNGKTRILKVAHSEKWKASKIKHKEQAPSAAGHIDYDVNRVHRPFDWTYTTSFKGQVESSRHHFEAINKGIPYEELKKPDPIQFFDEVQLYEDELGDFGLATYSVKIRVMPTSLFVLARFYMRVDNVAFRIRDSRVYINFKTGEVIREYTVKEGSYDEVKSQVPIWADDFTQMLRDPNWVDSVLKIEEQKTERLIV